MLHAPAALLITALVTVAQAPDPNDPYRAFANNGSYFGYRPTGTPVADVITSQGNYLIATQVAASMREKTRQEKIATRKQEIEFWVWRKGVLDTFDDEQRKRARELELNRNIDEPSPTEIFAGIALNKLLNELIKVGPATPSASVGSETLSRIHVGSVADPGLGLLCGKSSFWPPLLAIPEFAEARARIDKDLSDLKADLASSRGVNQELALSLRREVKSLKDRLDRGLRDEHGGDVLWIPGNYTGAARLLSQIDNVARTLGNNPNVADYLRPPQGQTVAEVVTYMKERGLIFTEAMAGDETKYVALHLVMADELRRIRKAEGAGR
jgi:hypothetical protein